MIRPLLKVIAVAFAVLMATTALAQVRPFQIGGETVLLERAEESVGAYLRAFRPNEATGKWEVDVVVTNGSTRILKAPIVLRFDTAEQIGPGIVGATIDSSGLPFLNLSPLVTGGEFLPGQELRQVTLSLGDARTRPNLVVGIYSLPEVAPRALLAMRTLASDGTPLGGVSVEEIGPEQPRILLSEASGWISLESASNVRGWRLNSPGMVPVVRLNSATGNERVVEAPTARFVQATSAGPTVFEPENIPAPIPAGWSPLVWVS